MPTRAEWAVRGAAVLGLLGMVACARRDATPAASVLAHTRSALLAERFTVGRLVSQQSVACGLSGTVPPDSAPRCRQPLRTGTRAFARYAAAAREVSRAAASDTGPTTLHALALIDLRAAGGSARALDRAVATLERARASAPHDPALLNDLAVAYLEVGERDRRLDPLLRALDAVDQALRREAAPAEATFNRALVLERLSLVARAAPAWSSVLEAERDPHWRREAASHAQAAARGLDTLTAREYPQQARDALFRHLGEWGRLVLGGDDQRADAVLAAARAAGDSADRLGADPTVARVVRWIERASGDPARRRATARSVVALSRGTRAIDVGRYEEAEEALTTADMGLRPAGSPLAGWAAAYRAAAEMNQQRYAEADRRLRLVLDATTPSEPALRGRATWLRGTVALRRGEFEAANQLYAAARPHFARAKDAKSEASVAFVRTEGLLLAGRGEEGAAEAYRGLRTLKGYRRSVNLHNHLLNVAALARAAGLRYAAHDLVEEALAVGAAVGRPDVLVLGLCTRARDLAGIGDSAAAMADVDSAARVVTGLTGASRQVAAASVELARGQLLRSRDPSAGFALLTRAAERYHAIGVWGYESAALYELAVVARAVGRTDVARARLREGVALIERPGGSFASAASRSAFDETVERVFDAAIALELDAGRPEAAYAYLERERATVWARGPGGRGAAGCGAACDLAAVARAVPHDVLFVSYAVLPDRVAIWFASRRGTGHRSVAFPRDSLAGLLRQVGREAAGGAAERGARARLHTLLLGGLTDQLDGVRHLAVAPDREISAVPFAALWNPRAGRYVVADYTVRTVPSGAFARAAWSLARPPGPNTSALIIGAPLLDSLSGARAEPLPGADREARAVARLYQRPRVLTGARARRRAVVEALGAYPVFHFAGHAVFNGTRPELSYLALAEDDGGKGGRLSAWEIATMRLSKVRVVVLSACRTLSARPSRTGAAAGLASSFLHAGVPGTVSTLWDVDDDAVTDVLVTFHRLTQGGVDPPEALRRAQVAALTSPRADQRAPAVWAALVYSGP